jgi:predicted amino acid racemase
MYFNGYFPIKTNISIIAKINAVVEKLAGIRIRVTNTGSQSSQSEDLK